MARTRNYIESISTDFEQLDSMTQADIVYELFTRLEEIAKIEALRRIGNHAKMAGLIRPADRKRNGTPAPPLMERKEVEQCGTLALTEPATEEKQ